LTESYYKNTGGFGIKEHEELAAQLSKIKGRFLLSYNDSVIVRELYKGFNIRTTKEISYTLGKNRYGKNKRNINKDVNGSNNGRNLECSRHMGRRYRDY
jgi:site-specific DNA-adenine methylase